MSKHKHNYSQYSNKPKVVVDDAKMESYPHADPVGPLGVEGPTGYIPMNETIETKSLPETVSGMVVGCARLNVRSAANLFADVVCTLNAQSEIEINVEKSDKDWFYIYTATGIEGYCMRKYVEAHL